jgi:hypothetical protein
MPCLKLSLESDAPIGMHHSGAYTGASNAEWGGLMVRCEVWMAGRKQCKHTPASSHMPARSIATRCRHSCYAVFRLPIVAPGRTAKLQYRHCLGRIR